MHELMALLQEDGTEYLEFAEDEATLFFRTGTRLLTARKLTGQFPNYEAVLPRENNKVIIMRCDDITSAILRVSQFADERSGAIRLKLDNNELHLLANSNEMGEAEDVIETAYQSDPLTIGFNSQYLLDFLKAASTPEVQLELKDAQSAGLLRPHENGDEFKYRYVVMPMRI
jgi:DNA polymerase-3 subunit beta